MEIFKLLGVVVFLYLTWRNLKENYPDKLLISYSWMALLFMFIGGRLVYGLMNWGIWNENLMDWWQFWQKPGFSYYGGVSSILMLTWIYCQQNEWKLWSFLEDMTRALYLLIILFLVGDIFSTANWLRNLIYILILLLGLIAGVFVAKRYRSFVWYKSGKKGFVFLLVNFIVGLLLAIAGLVFKDGWINVIVDLVICLLSITELLILGEVFKK